MSAPKTPPHYWDLLTGADESMNPLEAVRWVLADLATVPARYPRWLLDDDSGREFTLQVLADGPGDELRLGLSAEGLSVDISCSRDASGYVRLVARVAGREVFVGYLDRPFEEYDIWPPGAAFAPRRTEEAPGRIGKRMSWIVLDSRAWPEIAPLANSAGFVLARAEE